MTQPAGRRVSRRAFLASAAAARLARAQRAAAVHVVPNFHPASCGWLTHFSKERVYCANSYFDHLDRVRDDPSYAFALSEVNNIIAMLEFRPERAAELKKRIAEARVELTNAFFLESTVSLSGGEALVRLGVEGLRWQERMFGVRPRFAWNIDVCGTHEQMPQICAGLGLEAMVYCRNNPTGKTVHWAESPDGSRILALSPGHYNELRSLWIAKGPLGDKDLAELDRYFTDKRKITPDGVPVLVLAGSGDYSLAPTRPENPSAFLKEWKAARPDVAIRFGAAGMYLDAVRKARLDLLTMKSGAEYDHFAFWIQNPRVKSWFRDCEHLLAAAEMMATCASLEKKAVYPVEPLHQAWLQMFLNMDRNTLWGAAGGMVFEHDRSWDARDRFEWVERQSRETIAAAAKAIARPGNGVAIVNPLSWSRKDPFFVLAGTPLPDNVKAHSEDGRLLCQRSLWSGAVMTGRRGAAPPAVKPVPFTETIRSAHYALRIDRATGAIASLKVLPGDREVLGGPANTVVFERAKKRRAPGDLAPIRADRDRIASSSDSPVEIRMAKGIATVVEVRGTLLGKPCVRRIWLHDDYPRIDFETEMNDLPDGTIALAEFPLVADITEVRRGVPYGFSHGAWSKPNPNLPGWTRGINPAVRWSHYDMGGYAGFAIFDRGLSGRELVAKTPLLFLYNAVEKYRGYPNPWLSGAGKHVVRYAIAAHTVPWEKARIPQMAFEFNAPPIVVPGCAASDPASFLEASDNMIVESLRREGQDIELRMAECLGLEGDAEVNLKLPYKDIAVTDMNGRSRRSVEDRGRLKFPVRPQEILTLRFRVEGRALPEPKLVTAWDAMVPQNKRAALHEYTNDKGHPPAGV
jgi:hypothetical protein